MRIGHIADILNRNALIEDEKRVLTIANKLI